MCEGLIIKNEIQSRGGNCHLLREGVWLLVTTCITKPLAEDLITTIKIKELGLESQIG